MAYKELREAVTFENEGQRLFGILHKPENVKTSLPAVVICHGLAGTKVGKYRLYVTLAESLAKAGIATLRFDFRGSGDSEGAFNDMSISSEVSDTKAAIKFLTNFSWIDPSRIGLLGRSLGGVIAILTAAQLEIFKSLALWAPPFSGRQWLEKWKRVQNPKTSASERKNLMQFSGHPTFEPFLRELFALQLEDELSKLSSTPLLHIHGEEDTAIDLIHADDYAKSRGGSEGETKIVRLQNSDHNFSHHDERTTVLRETIDWFQRTL